MNHINFEMTYPCYSPIQPNGVPYILEADGKNAIAICTDEDVLNNFFDQLVPDAPFKMRAKFDDKIALRDWLQQWLGQSLSEDEQITHLLIDPNFSLSIGRMYSIAAFTQHLEME